MWMPYAFALVAVTLTPTRLTIALSSPRSSAKSKMPTYKFTPDRKDYDMKVTSLHRYAVKGLSGDPLKSAHFKPGDGTFEDDRRYALLYEKNSDKFDSRSPEWLHKEQFLCAFTDPKGMAKLDTEYRVESCDEGGTTRTLTVWDRSKGRTSDPLVRSDLACESGRDQVARFFTERFGEKVVCVVAQTEDRHTHQFGNTSSGVKNNDGDTRLIHIINSNTVKELSGAIFEDESYLRPTTFRPNVVVDGLEPWAEFDLIGKTIESVPKDGDCDDNTMRFLVTSRTVRCAGIGVDPERPEEEHDIPASLIKHFPEHGPYLGIYAVRVDGEKNGVLSVGETFRVIQ